MNLFRHIRLTIFVCAGITGAVFMTCCLFYPADIFLALFCIFLPLSFFFLHKRRSARAAPDPAQLRANQPMSEAIERTPLKLPRFSVEETMRAIFIATLLVNGVVAANVLLDHSAGKPYAVVIMDKYVSHQKYSTEHNIKIMTPVPSPLLYRFNDIEIFDLKDGGYEGVIPGRSTINFQIHPGFLGFPWYESRYFIIPNPQ